MHVTTKTVLLALALSAVAAPVEKRQLGGSTGSFPSWSWPAGGGSGLPTGGGSGFPTGGGSGFPTGGGSGLPTGGGSGFPTGGGSGLPTGGGSGFPGSGLPTGGGGLSGLGGSTGTSKKGELSGLPDSTGTTSGSNSDSSTSANTAAAPADGSCKAISLLFARGTGETGTMGTVIGPALAKALSNAAGADKVSTEGVEYAASSAGNANLGAEGGAAMAKQAQAILSSCPNTKLVLSGYSQGAMVVHNALSSQGLDGSKVAAVVAFGDPFNGQGFKGVDASKAKEFCGGADFLCSSGGTTGSGSHLSYGGDAEAAAQFIVQAVGA